MFIKPTNATKGALLTSKFAQELLLYTVNRDVPFPYEPSLQIKNGKVIFDGVLSKGGNITMERCVCEVSFDRFSKLYRLAIPDGEDFSEELLAAATADGWVKA